MTQDLSGYTRAYYERDVDMFRPHGVLRPDQLAALCYALDWPYWGHERGPVRAPGLIVSIGAGRGELERTFEEMGHVVVGVDPSPGAHELYAGRRLRSTWDARLIGDAATIVWCESLEHVPLDDTLALLEHVTPGTRLVFVNFVDFWPLMPSDDGWDHVTQVDDDLYDRLSAGFTVVLRRGSHLVLDA